MLRRRTVGRAYVYETVTSKEAHTAELMRTTLASGGNRAATLVHFLERLSPEESAALEAALKVYPPGDRA